VPSTAKAYSLNVTAVPKTNFLGYITVWPSDQPQPGVSMLNSTDGRVKAGAAIVPAAATGGGAISVFATDLADVVLDINGYFVDAASNPSALAFFTLPPCRVVDTRYAGGSLGPPSMVAWNLRFFPILTSSCNIPTTAQAYSLNYTAVPKFGVPIGFLSTWPTTAPDAMPVPWVSTLNVPTGAVTANAAIVPAGQNGAISVLATSNSDILIDINGYFAPSTSPSDLSFYTVPPCRVRDTRYTTGLFSTTPIPIDTSAAPCGIPPSAQAVVVNATVVPTPPGLGYLTLWPHGLSQPNVSTLNASDGFITANMAIVPTSSAIIDAYGSEPTQLVLDTTGYFASATAPAPNAALTGRYAFTLQGFDPNGNLVTTAGSFVADGNGNITAGFLDRYKANVAVSAALTGSYSVGADNRGTMTLTVSQVSHTFNFALGQISSGVATAGHLVEADVDAAVGILKKQDPSAFSTFGSTAASFAFGGRGQIQSGRTAVVGQATFNGSGGFSGIQDYVNTTGVGTAMTIAGTYTVGDTTNGRGTLAITSPVPNSFAFYIVSMNEVFLIDTNPTAQYDAFLTMTALKQSASFPAPANGSVSVLSSDALSNNCSGGGNPGSRVELSFLQWGTAGNGVHSGDENECGTATTMSAEAFTYTVAANGRVTLAAGPTSPVLYLVSSGKGFMVGTELQTVEFGFFEPQAGSNFNNASLSGDYFFGTQPLARNGSSVGVGVVTLDGNGHLTGTTDDNFGGTITTETFADTYSVAASGRVTTSDTVVYIISTSKAVMIDGGHGNFPKISVIEK